MARRNVSFNDSRNEMSLYNPASPPAFGARARSADQEPEELGWEGAEFEMHEF